MADNISELSVASEDATLAPSGSGGGGGGGGKGDSGGGGDAEREEKKKDKKDHYKKDHKTTSAVGTLQILTSGKKDKKEKKEKEKKEKETKYSHLGEVSSGDEHDGQQEGKSPAKSKLRSAKVLFGSAKKDGSKSKDGAAAAAVKDHDESAHAAALAGSSADPHQPDGGNLNPFQGPSSIGSSKDTKKESKKKDGEKSKKSLKLGSVVVGGGSSSKKSKAAAAAAAASAAADVSVAVPTGGGGDGGDNEATRVFGVPLDVAVARSKCHDGLRLPLAVRMCIDHIEEHGLMIEGVYRSSGVKSKINKLRTSFNAGGQVSGRVHLTEYEPAVVASAFKQFLRELPDPVLTQALTPSFESVSADANPQKRIEGMKNLIGQLPVANRTLLQWVFVHMSHVIEHQKFNKMTLQNVSIVLSPTMNISHRVLNCLFENSHILFEGVVLKRYVPPLTGDAGSVKLPETPEDIRAEISKQESLLSDLHLEISSGAASKRTEDSIWEQQRIMTQLKRKLRTAAKESSAPAKKSAEPIDYEEELDFRLQQVAIEEEQPAKGSVPEEAPVSESQPADKTEAADVVDAAHATTVVTVNQDTASEKGSEAVKPDQKTQVTAVETGSTNVTVIKLNQAEVNQESEQPKSCTTQTPVVTAAAAPDPPASKAEEQPSEQLEQQQAAAEQPQEKQVEQQQKQQAGLFPLLPKPPSRETKNRVVKPSYNNILQPTLVPPTVKPVAHQSLQDQALHPLEKSKSLPRGHVQAWPTDDNSQEESAAAADTDDPAEVERLQTELLRLQYENEELEALKSELEWRKRSERKEIKQLGEEMATMQTLYQYRTYSVDSSESSSDDQNDVEEVEELRRKLAGLIRDNKELEEKRMALCDKIQQERSACVQLRVEIKLEQERIRKRNC